MKKRDLKQVHKTKEAQQIGAFKKSEGKYRKWTEDEEEKFIEAVRIYGRNMRKVSEFVGTRDTG